jgi:hypothetical protein
VTTAPAPHARLCCPPHALAELTAAELAVLNAYCARALDDPEAEPIGEEEIAAVARYERVLASSGADVLLTCVGGREVYRS